ncbi:MAG: L-serine ammonia-lyase [Rhodospirillaceae bacterium]|nr:MAG: L-serine ammonia-lyase [Rhodospirillaceae bacterium]
MFLSVFEIFKVGIGPSSSHTNGPMVAARRFLHSLDDADMAKIAHVQANLYGSLALTGHGHGTDRAVALGLLDLKPDNVDPDAVEGLLQEISEVKTIALPNGQRVRFDNTNDIIFNYSKALPGHPNGMVFLGFDAKEQVVVERTYYSVGGGFVVDDRELETFKAPDEAPDIPFAYASADEMLSMGKASKMSLVDMKRANELAVKDDLDAKLDAVWAAMQGSLKRGLKTEGILPGGLKVKRRAKCIHDQLLKDQSNTQYPHTVMDWISVYALAVNEENAAGGRIVTAPTNGAAGIIPAVIQYYLDFCPGADQNGVHEILLVAAAIGGLIKHNASISGAEVGCQGEVGSAAAMAAAGLCAALGGTNEQAENAAEIALEHHLGMTCDPIGGLVQVPCIERNAMGAVKAISAASLSLKGDGTHLVSLDSVIKTMRETGRDMMSKYKETSQGGLAVNVTEC